MKKYPRDNRGDGNEVSRLGGAFCSPEFLYDFAISFSTVFYISAVLDSNVCTVKGSWGRVGRRGMMFT